MGMAPGSRRSGSRAAHASAAQRPRQAAAGRTPARQTCRGARVSGSAGRGAGPRLSAPPSPLLPPISLSNIPGTVGKEKETASLSPAFSPPPPPSPLHHLRNAVHSSARRAAQQRLLLSGRRRTRAPRGRRAAASRPARPALCQGADTGVPAAAVSLCGAPAPAARPPGCRVLRSPRPTCARPWGTRGRSYACTARARGGCCRT
jgi:hypothetical protein